MVTWYWSADTFFWQVSIDHNMDVQYQRSTHHGKSRLHVSQPFIWSMAAMLRDSVVVVVVTVVRTRPRAIPLAMITMRKLTHGFPFLSYMSMGLRSAALRAAGAPLISRYPPLRLSKRQSQTAVLFRTTLTQTITLCALDQGPVSQKPRKPFRARKAIFS